MPSKTILVSPDDDTSRTKWVNRWGGRGPGVLCLLVPSDPPALGETTLVYRSREDNKMGLRLYQVVGEEIVLLGVLPPSKSPVFLTLNQRLAYKYVLQGDHGWRINLYIRFVWVTLLIKGETAVVYR